MGTALQKTPSPALVAENQRRWLYDLLKPYVTKEIVYRSAEESSAECSKNLFNAVLNEIARRRINELFGVGYEVFLH